MADKDFNYMSPWGQMARCIVNPDHSVAYFLDKDNSNLKADGSTIDWAEVEAKDQNVMVQIPKFYYIKKWIKEQQAFIFGVTDKPITTDFINQDEWQIHPAFYRDRTKLCDDQSAVPELVDYRYYGAFHGWKDSKNRLRSLPKKAPLVNITIGDARNLAKNMGVGWSQLDYYLVYATQMLYISEYGHPNAQTQIGRGFVDGNSAAINTGGTLINGNNTFGETTGKKQMSYRGIEDWWGNVYDWVDGLFCDSSRNILIGNKGFNNTGQGYENVGNGGGSNVSGNIRHIQSYDKAGFIIKSSGGSYDNDGLCDYGDLFAGYLPRFGAGWSDGSVGGPFLLDVFISASNSRGSLGARLVL
jgi:hypothetical protein